MISKKTFAPAALVLLMFSSCDKGEEEKKYEPSVIEFELQTIGDLSGGIFGEKHTLIRKTLEYQADDENGTYGSIKTYPDSDEEVVDIMGWGNNIHPQVKQIYLRIPSDGLKTYTFEAETSEEKNFWLHLETTYSAELQAGYTGWGVSNTRLSVTISEISEDRIKGSFTADLLYFNVESVDGGKRMILDEEISHVNQPIINGTFDVFRETY